MKDVHISKRSLLNSFDIVYRMERLEKGGKWCNPVHMRVEGDTKTEL
jgi:hypothetical protein